MAYAARKGNLEEQERKADKLREQAWRRKGYWSRSRPRSIPKDVGWWDLSTNRLAGFLSEESSSSWL